MKPRLGRKVYCLYNDCIFTDEVGYVGKESFIVAGFGPLTKPATWEYWYKDYEKKWFTNLVKAKKELLNRYKDEHGDKAYILPIGTGYYELCID